MLSGSRAAVVLPADFVPNSTERGDVILVFLVMFRTLISYFPFILLFAYIHPLVMGI